MKWSLVSLFAAALLMVASVSAAAPTGWTLVSDATYKVTNDEDSGVLGYWAIDNYNKHVQVYQNPSDATSFYAIASYAGKWNTFAGALSPATGTSESMDATGTSQGGYEATFTAPSFTAVSGNLGTYDFGGSKTDVLLGTYGAGQTGPTTPYSFFGQYFPGYSNFNYVNWGWTYHYRSQAWNNLMTGNSGDIVV